MVAAPSADRTAPLRTGDRRWSLASRLLIGLVSAMFLLLGGAATATTLAASQVSLSEVAEEAASGEETAAAQRVADSARPRRAWRRRPSGAASRNRRPSARPAMARLRALVVPTAFAPPRGPPLVAS